MPPHLQCLEHSGAFDLCSLEKLLNAGTLSGRFCAPIQANYILKSHQKPQYQGAFSLQTKKISPAANALACHRSGGGGG